MAEESDRVLVARARRGDARSLEVLVRRYLRPAFAVALALLRNVEDAEDLAQEALMIALQRLEQCRDPNCFAAWLFSSIRNRALNQLNQRGFRDGVLNGTGRADGMEASAARLDLRERLLTALEELTTVQREVVLLHDLEGWTHLEIASAIEISEVASRQTLFVARKQLRRALGDDSQEEARHE